MYTVMCMSKPMSKHCAIETYTSYTFIRRVTKRAAFRLRPLLLLCSCTLRVFRCLKNVYVCFFFSGSLNCAQMLSNIRTQWHRILIWQREQ